MHETIGVVFDFDDTLAPDTTWGFLEWWGLEPRQFWREQVDPLLDEGWDPIPAYLYAMIEASKARPAGERITRDKLAEYGRGVRMYEGVSRIFEKLTTLARSIHPDIRIEFYVISSGIRDILVNTRISRHFTHIWACDFHCGPVTGEIIFPRRVVSFTDKTRYLFQISKGLVGSESEKRPFEVNKRIPWEKIRIPLNQIIYVGDGYTDIPCFSLVMKQQGVAIGVFDPNREEKWRQAWEFIEEGRVSNLAPSDYRRNSALEISLRMAVNRISHDIILRRRTYRE